MTRTGVTAEVPPAVLTDGERQRLARFPTEISADDLTRHFILSPRDLEFVATHRGDHNRLGVALQLCALRFLGFVPDDLATAPLPAVAMVARQLHAASASLAAYGDRPHTRTDHLAEVMAHLGFVAAAPQQRQELRAWLLDRALEHDRPSLLFSLACERLHALRVVRPAAMELARLVATAREQAAAETDRRLRPTLTPSCVEALDTLLQNDPAMGRSRLVWLRTGAVATTPKAILTQLEKLGYLRGLGADRWDLSALSPNRLKFLADLGQRTSPQALGRAAVDRRHPILLAFCATAVADLTDEVVDLVDRSLAATYGRARHELEEMRRRDARATNTAVRVVIELGRIVLDPEVDDAAVRERIAAVVGLERLRQVVTAAERRARPEDDEYFDLLEHRYEHLREFAPAFLAAFVFRSNGPADRLLAAVDVVRELNATRRRKLPDDAPMDFVPARWRPYVLPEGSERRRYDELCVLMELRAALRAGDVWLAGSRRYANPETYLIPSERWSELRAEVARQTASPSDGAVRLAAAEVELKERLGMLDERLAAGAGVRIEEGRAVLTPLSAEAVDDRVAQLAAAVAERLPRVELADLLIEVDGWTDFSRHLVHAGGAQPRSDDHARHLYAAILAQASNLGLVAMADVADLSYRKLAWTNDWYLREETLRPAIAAVVDHHYRHPLAHAWGDGSLSSSDGQRFAVGVKAANATALPRYFVRRGLTFYSHASDQSAAYGTKVIPATVRDATYVLDAILDNETELPVQEHATDTAGFTEIVFGLFDVLGLTFSPRIRDLGDQVLYRLPGTPGDSPAAGLLRASINRERIIARWDDLLRVAGSLKLGWVTASLFITRLQASPRQNALAVALKEHGRLIKTLYALRYYGSEDYRRRIHRQLNKGESLHALRRFLFFGNEGQLRRRQIEDQANQASCLTLLTNAVVTWNTTYMSAALEQLAAAGHEVREDDLVHLSPTLHEHINPYGKYRFDVDGELTRSGLRPLRQPDAWTVA